MTRRAQFFVLPSRHVSRRHQHNDVKMVAMLRPAVLSLMTVLVLCSAPASAAIETIGFDGDNLRRSSDTLSMPMLLHVP